MHSLADSRNLIIRKTDKGLSAMVSDCNVCIIEANKKLKNAKICKEVEFNKKILQDNVGTSSK